MNSVLRSPGGKYVDIVLCDVLRSSFFAVICVSQPHTKLPDFKPHARPSACSFDWMTCLCEDCDSFQTLQDSNPPSPVPFELFGRRPTHPTVETVSGCNQKMMATNGVWHRIYSIDPCTIVFRNLWQTVVTMICKHFLLQKKTVLVSVPPFSEKNLSLCLKNTTKVRRDSCHIRNVSIKRPLPTGH